MQYGRLGRSGLVISRIVLGCSTFGELVDEAQAGAIAARAWDLGITACDTGDIYAAGESEAILGRLLRGRRDQVVVSTKVGFRVGDGEAEHAVALAGRSADVLARWRAGVGPNDHGLSAKHVKAAVEASLRRLGTDYIDLYQIHRWDPSTPIDETLRALDDLVRAGKVRYVGASNFAAWQITKALWAGERGGFASCISTQAVYNLLHRRPEDELLPACAADGVGVLAYSTLAAGLLGGAHRDATPARGTLLAARASYRALYWTDASRRRAARLAAYADACGRAPAELAIGWALGRPEVSAAIVGATSPDEIEAHARAADRPLDAAARAEALAAIEDDGREAGV